MKIVSTALLGAAMLALTACGGATEEAAVDNAATDTLALPEDELLAPTDNTLGEVPADSLGNEATTDANLAVDANVVAEANGL